MRLFRSQAAMALAAVLALESLFAAMARLGDLSLHVIATIVLALGAGIVYCVALYALEHSRESRAAVWIVLAGALLFRITLAPLPPSLSTDLHRYRWDGRVQNHGWNPYLIAPVDSRLASLRDAGWAVMPVPEIPTMYPPLSELIFGWAERLTRSVVGFKAPFVLADLLVVALLAGWLRSAGGRNYQLAVYAWSPLVIVEFAGSGHNDALAIAGLVLGLWMMQKRPVGAALAIAAGALAKLFPVTLLLLAVRRAGWPQRAKGWLAAAGAGALILACAWPYRSAYPQLPATFAYYRRIFHDYNGSLYTLISWLTGHGAIAAGIGEGTVLGLAVWVAMRKTEPARAAYLLIGAILMLAPNGYSWYFTWIVPLLCFFPNPAWLLLTILQFLSYNVLIAYRITGAWHFGVRYQWMTYAPFYALLLATFVVKRRRALAMAQGGKKETALATGD